MTGTFQSYQSYYPRGGNPHWPYVADVNGDGGPDLVDMSAGAVTVGLNQCGP